MTEIGPHVAAIAALLLQFCNVVVAWHQWKVREANRFFLLVMMCMLVHFLGTVMVLVRYGTEFLVQGSLPFLIVRISGNMTPSISWFMLVYCSLDRLFLLRILLPNLTADREIGFKRAWNATITFFSSLFVVSIILSQIPATAATVPIERAVTIAFVAVCVALVWDLAITTIMLRVLARHIRQKAFFLQLAPPRRTVFYTSVVAIICQMIFSVAAIVVASVFDIPVAPTLTTLLGSCYMSFTLVYLYGVQSISQHDLKQLTMRAGLVPGPSGILEASAVFPSSTTSKE